MLESGTITRGTVYTVSPGEDMDIVKHVAEIRSSNGAGSTSGKDISPDIKGALGELAMHRLLGIPIVDGEGMLDPRPNRDIEDRGDVLFGGYVIDVKTTVMCSYIEMAVMPSKMRRADYYVLMAIHRRKQPWTDFSAPFEVEFIGSATARHVFSPVFAGAPYSAPFRVCTRIPWFHQISFKLPLHALATTFPPENDTEEMSYLVPKARHDATREENLSSLRDYMRNVGLNYKLAPSVAQYLPGYVDFPLAIEMRDYSYWRKLTRDDYAMIWRASEEDG